MVVKRGVKKSEVAAVLEKLIEKSGSLTGLLITKEGVSFAEAGDTSYLNTTAMAALVAGMFSATREVARLVGEDQFSILLQQGENRHIHISLIQDSGMMVVIFEGYERIGRVRHEARKTGEELSKMITDKEEKRQEESREKKEKGEGIIATSQFKEYALNAIDRIFETR